MIINSTDKKSYFQVGVINTPSSGARDMFASLPRGSPGVVTPYVRKVIICTVQTYSLGILGLKCQGLELGTKYLEVCFGLPPLFCSNIFLLTLSFLSARVSATF